MDVQQVYTSLFKEIEKYPNNYILNKDVCLKVKMLTGEYANFLLGLINHHYCIVDLKRTKVSELDLVKSVTKKSNILGVPYGGKTHENGKGPTFTNINNKFPITLKQLIAAYIKYISI